MPKTDGRWGVGKDSPPGDGSVWPSRSRELFLKAALLDGPPSYAAWKDWNDEGSPRVLENDSKGLAPLVYLNLTKQGFLDPEIEALKRHYLLSWARNQRIFRAMRGTLGQLQAKGIDALVLKGAALIPLYYKDAGARGMEDFDVLVPEDRFRDAVDVLQRSGWTPDYWDPDLFDIRFQHAIPMLDAKQNSVDLHCHVLPTSCESGADADFWDASLPVHIEGVETRSLCPTDLLLHVCVHGMNWTRYSPIRWIADAIIILQEAGKEVDWERLTAVSRARGVTLQLSAPLEYLRDNFAASVPAEVLRSLRVTPTTWIERYKFRNDSTRWRGRPVPLLLHHWFMFNRGIGQVGWVKRVASIGPYLRFVAQARRLWKVPSRLFIKAVRAIGNRLGWYRYWDD